jgi:hypothetical protein
VFPYLDPKFWEAYRNVPAWQFSRFLAIAERGKPSAGPAKPVDAAAAERADLEASAEYVHRFFAM